MIRGLRALGKTVLLTTHYLDEAQHLADRVAIIAGGEIVAEGPPSILTGRDPRTTIRFRLAAGAALPDGLGDVAVDGDMAVLWTEDPTRALHTLTAWALERGAPLQDLTVARPSLEDVYLELTGEEKPG